MSSNEDGGVTEHSDMFADYPVDRRSCSLLGPTALIVQGLMGVLVVSSLLYKRHRESPKRPWRIWSFDVSKQVIGQLFVHAVNLLISDFVAHRIAGNACVYYFLNIGIDTTLGVFILYLILRVTTYVFSERFHLKGFEMGQYGDPPSFGHWMRQTAVYVFSLTSMKMIVIGLFALFPGIFRIAEWLLNWTEKGDKDYFQVIFVMGIFPIIMNVIQFWIIDSIVKAHGQAALTLPPDPPSGGAEEEPLFRASVDDDDDGDEGVRGRPHDIENPAPKPSNDGGRTKTFDNDTSEPKPVTGSGSSTPGGMTPGVQAAKMHSYPPSIVSSPPSRSHSRSRSSRETSTSPKPPHTKTTLAHLVLPASTSPGVTRSQLVHREDETNGYLGHVKTVESEEGWDVSWDDADSWAQGDNARGEGAQQELDEKIAVALDDASVPLRASVAPS